eukprot:5034510-Alexandrium_andersonii.AAC.1
MVRVAPVPASVLVSVLALALVFVVPRCARTRRSQVCAFLFLAKASAHNRSKSSLGELVVVAGVLLLVVVAGGLVRVAFGAGVLVQVAGGL